MKCIKCDEPAVAHDGDTFICRIHLRERAPEYTVDCPHCELEITVN